MKHRLIILIALLVVFVGFISFRGGDISGNAITGYAGRAESERVVLETHDEPQLYSSKTFVKRGTTATVQLNFGKYGVSPTARFVRDDGSLVQTYTLCNGIACYGTKNIPLQVSRSILPGLYRFEVRGLLHPDKPVPWAFRVV